MNKGQEIFLLIILLMYIVLLVWLFINELYIEILKSFAILLGSFVLGMIMAKLGEW